ncbi:hypothetical protein WJX74_003736 [Apatococcus lobatus]|uniref:CW-type domain-containing protein n=1 Tax=Apatococcus lobatus TaxID=904363 RepID=A0AAW1RUC4_9CHLO
MGKSGKFQADAGGKAPGKAPIWSWACCDNQNCQKWRRLPPGTAVDPNIPWFCYMNPDEDMNSCDVPEENYINDVEYAQEPEPVSVPSPGAPSKKNKSKGRGRGKQVVKGGKVGATAIKNGRIEKVQGHYQGGHKAEGLVRSQHSGRISRPPTSSGYLKEEQWSPPRGAAAYQQPTMAGGQKRKRGQTQSDSGDEGSSDGEEAAAQAGPSARSIGPNQKRSSHTGSSAKAAAAKIGPGKAKKLHKGFEKLLACGGVWEAAKGRGRAVTTAPHWIWEGLASYDPDAAELAVEAADMASTARYFMASGQLGSESVTPHDTELATRLTLAGAAVLAAAQTSKASNIGGKPAPAKAARDKGGTPLPNTTDTALSLRDSITATPQAEGRDPNGAEGRPSVGVGATDHDRLQQIMTSLRQPPSLPAPTPAYSAGINPGMQGSQPDASASAASGGPTAVAQARPTKPATPITAGSRKSVVQPWQQPPQLTLPPGVSFSDPRNLYSRGLPGFPAMGKAAPYQGPPPSYQPPPQPIQHSMPPPAARGSTLQAGHTSSWSKAPGQHASPLAGHPSSRGALASAGHPTHQQQQQQPLLQHSAVPQQSLKQQQQQQQPQSTLLQHSAVPQQARKQQQQQQHSWPTANGFHPMSPRQPLHEGQTQQQATANGPGSLPASADGRGGGAPQLASQGPSAPSQQASARSPADIVSPGQTTQAQQHMPGVSKSSHLAGPAARQDGFHVPEQATQDKQAAAFLSLSPAANSAAPKP